MKFFQNSKINLGIITLLLVVIGAQSWIIVSHRTNRSPKNIHVSVASSGENEISSDQQAQTDPKNWSDDFFGSQDPFADLQQMRKRMHTMMDQAFEDPFFTDSFSSGFETQGRPVIVLKDEKDHYCVEVSVPGVKEPQINAELKDNTLVITSVVDKEDTKKDENNHNYQRSRSFGNFMQTLSFDDPIDPSTLTSRYENEKLILEVQKVNNS